MPDVLLYAHGSWNPSSTPAYALVPKGSRLLFFTENLKLFVDSSAARDAIASAEPSEVVEGYKWAQNYGVSPVGQTFAPPAGMVFKAPQGDQLLCTSDECGKQGWHNPATCGGIFADPDVQGADIYFMACRYMELNEAGSPEYYAETGVNQRQDGIGYDGSAEVSHELSNSGADMWLDSLNQLGSEEEAHAWMAEHTAELSPDQLAMVSRRIQERFPAWSNQP
jgi:hypothetical protein